VRVDVTEGDPASFRQAGLKVIMLIPGDCQGSAPKGYSSGGVGALDPQEWAQCAVNLFGADCAGSAVSCPAVEVLNEPAGGWFWGENADSRQNASAYATLLADTWTAFNGQYGTAAPAILASYDGGSDSSVAWGQEWWTPQVSQYVGGVTVHPYGGTGDPTQSAQGNRMQVTEAHQQTDIPVWVTEVGWPTGTPNADSLQWTADQQAANVTSFGQWAASTGYVAVVTYYGWASGAYGLQPGAMQAIAQANTASAATPAIVASQPVAQPPKPTSTTTPTLAATKTARTAPAARTPATSTSEPTTTSTATGPASTSASGSATAPSTALQPASLTAAPASSMTLAPSGTDPAAAQQPGHHAAAGPRSPKSTGPFTVNDHTEVLEVDPVPNGRARARRTRRPVRV